METRRLRGAEETSVKGHCGLLLDEQALRGTNKTDCRPLSLVATTLDTVFSKMDN